VEWDWIGEDSPMLADVGESEWVLDRLCESLNRYTRKQARDTKARQHQQKKERGKAGDNSSKHHIDHWHDKHLETCPAHPGPRHPYTQETGRHCADKAAEATSSGSSGSGSTEIEESFDHEDLKKDET